MLLYLNYTATLVSTVHGVSSILLPRLALFCSASGSIKLGFLPGALLAVLLVTRPIRQLTFVQGLQNEVSVHSGHAVTLQTSPSNFF